MMQADNDDTSAGLEALLEASTTARQQALALIDRAASDVSTGAAISHEQLVEIAQLQRQFTASIALLRTFHRSAYFSARDTKAQTAEARQEVDRLHLQLQNLYYEQKHLQGEIAACENYDHSYKHLPLIPAEEFLELHPEHATDDEATIMTARIAHEKKEREALEQQRHELLRKKLKLINENKKRKEDLASLDNDLERFIDAAKPIQNLFDKVV